MQGFHFVPFCIHVCSNIYSKMFKLLPHPHYTKILSTIKSTVSLIAR